MITEPRRPGRKQDAADLASVAIPIGALIYLAWQVAVAISAGRL